MVRLLVLLGGVAAALIVAGVSFATHNYSGTADDVTIVGKGPDNPGGNAYCPANTILGPKIDPGANYSDQYLTISGYDGNTFDWAFTALGSHAYDMAVVIVKGGPNSAVYTYDYTAGTSFDDSDSNLSAPTNPANGKDYGISHIQVCYDPKGGGDN
ncbi:MAG TPA: hypothetical protein VFO26_07065 [Gaiella sp.]|uniref:hypothetical protein n=1 Tax=Gaiella sp. TaxID=2663207 RepID=UPI002D7E5A6B|nr:hypothetical protein [Gaiella sp.]HET9287302.1 hypothetical protein [Gaiella sp.]